MQEKSIDLTEAVTPEPETAQKAKKVLLVATVVAAGAFVAIKALERFKENKHVELKVVDNPSA